MDLKDQHSPRHSSAPSTTLYGSHQLRRQLAALTSQATMGLPWTSDNLRSIVHSQNREPCGHTRSSINMHLSDYNQTIAQFPAHDRDSTRTGQSTTMTCTYDIREAIASKRLRYMHIYTRYTCTYGSACKQMRKPSIYWTHKS